MAGSKEAVTIKAEQKGSRRMMTGALGNLWDQLYFADPANCS